MNLSTGERTDPVEVQDDGTFQAQIEGRLRDGYAMHVYDQGRADDDVDNHRVLTFSSADARPVVAYGLRGQPEPTDLIMSALTARDDGLSIDRGVTPGSVVTVTDLETKQQTTLVADRAGSLEIPADVKLGRVFELRVQNPFLHLGAAHPNRKLDGLERTVRVQVKRGRKLVAVATDKLPPSPRTGHVRAASLDDRTFDPNRDLDFAPTRLEYAKDSRGHRVGGLVLTYASSEPVNARGLLQTRAVRLSHDQRKLQIVLEPSLDNAVGRADGKRATFRSTVGQQHGGFSTGRGDVSFRPPDMTNSYQTHIDVELVRPDGTLLGTAKMKPGEVLRGRDGAPHVDDWAFADYQPAKAEQVVPLLDVDGIADGQVRAPHVRAAAYIEPRRELDPAKPMSAAELASFAGSDVSGKLVLQLGLSPPAGGSLDDIEAIEVVNATAHPRGFDDRDAIERANIDVVAASGGHPPTDQALLKLSQAATDRLDLHLGDHLLYRAVMKDGTTSLSSDPLEVNTPARKKGLTRNGDFISAGVVTRYEQIPVGDTWAGNRQVVKGGRISQEEIVMAPPPRRDGKAWAESVKLKKGDAGQIEMHWSPGAVQAGLSFSFSKYSTRHSYGSDRLYATTRYERDAPGIGERPRLTFPDPGDDGVVVISLGGEQLVYPPKMARDRRVKALFG